MIEENTVSCWFSGGPGGVLYVVGLWKNIMSIWKYFFHLQVWKGWHDFNFGMTYISVNKEAHVVILGCSVEEALHNWELEFVGTGEFLEMLRGCQIQGEGEHMLSWRLARSGLYVVQSLQPQLR